MQKVIAKFGLEIRARRKSIRVTQKQLALLAGCSRLLISELENGRGNPRLENAISILHVLGLQLVIEEGQGQIVSRLSDAVD